MKTKKWELIKQAYENYPKGTKFVWFKNQISYPFISNGDFKFQNSSKSIFSISLEGQENTIFDGEKWAEIITEEPNNSNWKQPKIKATPLPKQKIAVKAENEKEFNAMQKYCSDNGYFYTENTWNFCKTNILYYDLLGRSVSRYKPNNCTIITFTDFAKEHNIKLPLLVSEDGVDLYEGDHYHITESINKKWIYSQPNVFTLRVNSFPIRIPEFYKAFHSKQSALDWIEKENDKLKKEVKVGDVVKAWDKDESSFMVVKLTEINNTIYPYISNKNAFKNAKKLTKEEFIQLLFGDEKIT